MDNPKTETPESTSLELGDAVRQQAEFLKEHELRANIEGQVRVKVYLELLLNLKLNPKHEGHAAFIRTLKEVVLGHRNILDEK